jgi:RND family efflux transporter MFP subunit
MKYYRYGLFAILLSFVPFSEALSQARPPSPVRYTEAKELPVRRQISLPGSVEARTSSLVASEVEGLVVSLRAHEGDRVEKGQVIVELRKDHLELLLEAAAAELREAEARLKMASRNMERSRELFESDVLSREQLDDSQYEFDAWQGRVERLSASIASTQLEIERSTVRAPFGGVIVAERTDLGQWVGKGDPVVELMTLDDLDVVVEVPERHYANIQKGAAATVSFEALPGFEVEGRVGSVNPQASAQARTFPVKVRIRNPEGRIGAGMLSQVSFSVGESYQATAVPKDALIIRGEGRFVYVLNSENTVDLVPVETGTGVGDWIEVKGKSAVQPGTKVVTRGNERLRPGQKVDGRPQEYATP